MRGYEATIPSLGSDDRLVECGSPFTSTHLDSPAGGILIPLYLWYIAPRPRVVSISSPTIARGTTSESEPSPRSITPGL